MNHRICTYRETKHHYQDIKHLVSTYDDQWGGDLDLTVTSQSIPDNTMIEPRYTKKGGNVSPHIKIENVPPQTKQLVLIMYDPDAIGKTFIHWFVVLDSGQQIIEAGNPGNLGTVMENDFNEKSYGGPSPPPGPVHRYYITVYALKDRVTFGKESYESILGKIKGHQIGSHTIMGKYGNESTRGALLT